MSFSNIWDKLPSETTMRNFILTDYFIEIRKKIKEALKDKKLMIISDESTIKQDKYHNIMAADIENPSNIFLLKVNYLTKNMDGDVVHDDILSCMREYDFKIDNLTLLITDAASYMKRGADI